MPSASVSDRSLGVDLARVIGVGAIVAGHTWSGPPVDKLLFSWHVPLFFLLTGYLWRADRPLGPEVRKRARTLLVPYVCWYVIVAGTWFTYKSRTDDSFSWSGAAETLLGGTYASRPFSAFWFITALFFACVLLRSLERLPTFVPWLVAALGLGLCYRDRFFMSDLPWSVGVGVTAMLFVLVGTELKRHRSAIPLPGLTGAVAIIAGLAPFVLDLVAPLNMKPGDFGSPILSVLASSAICVGLVLLCEDVASRLPHRLIAPVQPLALSALAVVLLHALLLAFIGDDRPAIGSYWLIYAIALVVPWVIGLLILRTPLRRYLL